MVLILKEKYNTAKIKGLDKDSLDKIRVHYKWERKTSKMYSSEHEQLKTEIGYEVPQCSDSLSSDGDDSNERDDIKEDS